MSLHPKLDTHTVMQERMESLQAANIAIIDNISASLFQQEEEGVPLTSFPGVNEMLGELKERVGPRIKGAWVAWTNYAVFAGLWVASVVFELRDNKCACDTMGLCACVFKE